MNQPIPPSIPTAIGTPNSTSGVNQLSRAELPDTITVGAKLEIQLAQELPSGMTDIRVRLADTNGGWSKPIQARILVTDPPENRAAGGAARPIANRLTADVVSVTPALVLKLQTNPNTRTEGIGLQPSVGTPQWLDAQLRRHLPQSQPLAKTLETWLTNQTQVQTQTHTQPVAASPPSVTRLFESILEGLARPADLTDPDRLSKAIAGAGIWLEATLARTALEPGERRNIEQDLKARLLLLANHLRRTNLDAHSQGFRPSPDRPNSGQTQQHAGLNKIPSNPQPQPSPGEDQTATAKSGRNPQTQDTGQTPASVSRSIPSKQMEALPAQTVERQSAPERLISLETKQLDTKRAGDVLADNRGNQAGSRDQRDPTGDSTATKEAATTHTQRPFEENLFRALTRKAHEIIKQAVAQQLNTQGRPGDTPLQPTPSPQTGTSVDPEIEQKLAPERQIPLETKGAKNGSLDNGSDQARPATGNRSAALGATDATERTSQRIPPAGQEDPAERLPVNEQSQTLKARHPFDENLTRTLARDVDGMIKQLVTQQLQSLDRDPQEPRWILELPLRTEDRVMPIQADIRRKKGRSREQEPGWDMKLRLDLQKLGSLNIHLHLRGGRLNASLNSENRQGAEILQRNLEQLRTQLRDRELDVGSLHAGYRPEATTDPLRDSASSLLDDHA